MRVSAPTDFEVTFTASEQRGHSPCVTQFQRPSISEQVCHLTNFEHFLSRYETR